MQENYTTDDSEPSYDATYQKQVSKVLSDSQLKNVYEFILNSDDAVTVEEIRKSCNITNVKDKIDEIQGAHLIRQDMVQTTHGVRSAYTDDVILPGQESVINEYI